MGLRLTDGLADFARERFAAHPLNLVAQFVWNAYSAILATYRRRPESYSVKRRNLAGLPRMVVFFIERTMFSTSDSGTPTTAQ